MIVNMKYSAWLVHDINDSHSTVTVSRMKSIKLHQKANTLTTKFIKLTMNHPAELAKS